MFRLVVITTGKVIVSSIPTEKEAKIAAATEVRKLLSDTPQGRRYLRWCNNHCPWSEVVRHVHIEEMVGIWITIEEDEDVPDETTDDYEVVFVLKRGRAKHIGMYDAEEGDFVDQENDNWRYPIRVVRSYLMLPDDPTDTNNE